MHVTLVQDGRPARLLGWSTSTPGTTTTTSVSNSNPTIKPSIYTTFQVLLAGTGAISATVSFYVSNDDTFNTTPASMQWCATPVATITVSGTTTASDGVTISAAWKYVQARVSAISGTGATLSVVMGA